MVCVCFLPISRPCKYLGLLAIGHDECPSDTILINELFKISIILFRARRHADVDYLGAGIAAATVGEGLKAQDRLTPVRSSIL